MNPPSAPAPPDPKTPAAPQEHELRDPPDESVAGEEDPGSGLEQFSDAMRSPQPPATGKDSREPYGPGNASAGGDSGQQSASERDTSAPSTSSK